MIRILFVCTGNTCRSPMAHLYMQKKVIDSGIQDKYFIDSCGIITCGGEVATLKSIEAMREYEVDMSKHRSKSINDIDIKNYDIILCMTLSHKYNLLNMYKGIENKVFTLKEYVYDNPEDKDIHDPFGLNIDTYKKCAKEIVESVDKLIEKN